MKKPKFGDVVVFKKKLVRGTEHRVNKFTKIRELWNVWKKQDFPASGIFLGYRLLRNGTTEWDDGYKYFCHKEFIKVALICYSDKANPIYVPLNSMR